MPDSKDKGISTEAPSENENKLTSSDISRREVLFTLGGLGAAVGAGAAMWGGLELMAMSEKHQVSEY